MLSMVLAREGGNPVGRLFTISGLSDFLSSHRSSCGESDIACSLLAWTVNLSVGWSGFCNKIFCISSSALPLVTAVVVEVEAVCCFRSSATVGEVFFLETFFLNITYNSYGFMYLSLTENLLHQIFASDTLSDDWMQVTLTVQFHTKIKLYSFTHKQYDTKVRHKRHKSK